MKHIVIGIFLCITPLIIFSQEKVEYFNSGDSLIIKEHEGNFYANHIFKKKQTLYSLARYYKCEVPEIIKLNPILNERIVEIGDTIFIPFKKGLITNKLPAPPNDNFIPCYYDVKKKETLFRIARRYFDMPISRLKGLNDLKGNEISIGSKMLVGWFEMTWDKKDDSPTDSLTIGKKKDTLTTVLPEMAASPDQILVTEKGAALINKSAGEGYFALHANADPGTFIEITHPTSRRSMQVKVLAKLPRNTYTKDVKIVVSPAVANMLGAENSRFFVLLRYLKNK